MPSASPTGPTDTVAVAEVEKIIYHVCHDVRAPLRAISVLTDWIKEDLANSAHGAQITVAEHLAEMQCQIARADQMMVDLTTFSRVGRVADSASAVALGDVVSSAIEASGMPMRLTITTDLQVPAILAPRNEIELLFAALISNAAKHHDRDFGKATITASETPQGCQICVEDDGPGIPRQFHERVFELMTTLKSRDECEGSGLGLAIARKIVTALGGKIVVADHSADRGTRIVIDLPASIICA